MSALEATLAQHIKLLRLPEPDREYRFAAHHVGMGKGIKTRLKEHKLRDWRFDFAWPDKKIAVEVEGGAWTGGRHTRGLGFTQDIEKYGEAMALGWTIYRCDSRLIKNGRSIEIIKKLLEMCGNK